MKVYSDRNSYRVKKLEKDLNAANHRIGGLESSLAEKDGRNRALANEKRNLEDQLNDLRKELEKKDKQLLVAKKQVEEETVVRVDLENRLQSLKEELAFKEQLYKEVNRCGSCTQNQIPQNHVSPIRGGS
ncbi:B-type nuclear lamin [Apostichopus japonicus]|uniref:B-type nuclear lamin n=1 Tax=Stichopus japonicus TaxID=307972 RepID=A0A2G8K283_STIJA|nr:B-type nuclear lamin [Apostichopus japonicus]